MQMHSAFKPLIAAAVGGWLAMSAATASAQMTPQTADMSVTGTIVPAACSASFTGGGTVDFGTIRLIDLPNSALYPLGTKNVDLTVSCTSNKRVAFAVTDLQASNRIIGTEMQTALGTSWDVTLLGLGAGTVGGTPVILGSYVVALGAPVVNTTRRINIYSPNGGTSWTGPSDWIAADGARLHTAGSTATAPVTGTSFTFPLIIRAALNYGSRLQVAQDTRLNGQAVFAISYQ